MSNQQNPFGNDDDINPFAKVDVYNPFESPSFKQENVATTPPPPVSSRSLPESVPELKFREKDPTEAFYDETTVNETAAFNPPSISTTRSTGTQRVTVQRDSDDDETEVNFWQIKFYRRFFNVDSMDVLKRCGRSLFPFKNDFIDAIKTSPDFYGPFWISTTLVFMMAAAGNFAYYLDSLINPAKIYQYDFYKLIYGSGVIYGYAFIIPLLFWLYVKWLDLSLNLIDVLCIYGYSLFVYSPVALLCIIPNEVSKWIVVGIGCLFSTSFLVVNLWVPLKEKLTSAIITLIVITALHLGLALTFRLYFFNLSNE